MSADSYLKLRLRDQIAWYDASAKRKMTQHYVLSVLALSASGSIPVAVVVLNNVEWLLAVLGAGAAFFMALHGLLGPQEDWIRHRGTAESLKKEMYLFETRTGPYADLPEDHLLDALVQNVEDTVSRETQVWLDQASSRRPPLSG